MITIQRPEADSDLVRMFHGMYTDSDTDIRCYSVTVVRPYKPKKCPGNFAGALHDVPAKKRGIVERAIIDGNWRSCYTCEDCIIKFAQDHPAS